jgi:hypothetical protein
MRSEEPSDITRARDLLKKSEKSQEYTEQVRYFEAAVDLLTTQDGSPFEHLAATIKKTHIDKLIKDTPPPLLDIIKGLFDKQPAQWFREKFHPEDVYKAHMLLRALDAAL